MEFYLLSLKSGSQTLVVFVPRTHLASHYFSINLSLDHRLEAFGNKRVHEHQNGSAGISCT